MSEELKNATEEEVNVLKSILKRGWIEDEKEFEIYSKFIKIKKKLEVEDKCRCGVIDVVDLDP